MKAAQLRQAILQAAVQGKLVPQNPQDEPASELLKRIQAEKVQLVKEGKIKKEKPLPPVSEEEMLYDLPNGWELCRVKQLTSLITSGSRDWAKYYSKSGAIFLRMGNLSKDSFKLRLHSLQYVSPPANGEGTRTKLEPNDILVSITGDVGMLGLIPHGFDEAYINQHTAVVRFFQEIQYQLFPFFFLSPFCQEQFKAPQRGIKNSFRLTDLEEMIVPLPPIEEQQRIVDKLNKLFVFCDELEVAEKESDALDTNLAEYLLKSILQAAVQGKLVPQNSHDEPASELLKRIQAEKTRLVKAGEIKKEKPLPPVSEEEIPYDLPEGWKWCRLGSVILQNIGGGTPSKTVLEYWDGDIYWASVKDLSGKYLNTTRDMITNKGLMHSTSNLIPPGNIIVCTRMGLGKISINTIAVAINQDLRALLLSEHIDQDYFIYYYQGLSIAGSGMTVKGITIEELNTLLFPLPPLAEQQRIVTKVDELIALCKQLQNIPPDSALLLANIQKLLPFQSAPTSSAEPEEQYAMAARGAISATETKEHRQAVADLFGDDVDG